MNKEEKCICGQDINKQDKYCFEPTQEPKEEKSELGKFGEMLARNPLPQEPMECKCELDGFQGAISSQYCKIHNKEINKEFVEWEGRFNLLKSSPDFFSIEKVKSFIFKELRFQEEEYNKLIKQAEEREREKTRIIKRVAESEIWKYHELNNEWIEKYNVSKELREELNEMFMNAHNKALQDIITLINQNNE